MRFGIALGTLVTLISHTHLLAAPPQISGRIQRLMQDQQYAGAIQAIARQLQGRPANADYLLYLRGRALHFLQRYDAAVHQFNDLVKAYPRSQWARKARLAAGVSYAKAGKFKEAAAAYQQEVKYLLSAERRQSIAQIYLELADAHFKPSKVGVKPNYKQAQQFYLRAVEIGPQLKRMRVVRMRIAKCSQELKSYSVAAQQYRQFIKLYSADKAATEAVIEARFQLGESYLSAGKDELARRAWEELIRVHGQSKSPRIATATFRIGLSYGLPNPNSELKLSRGVAALRAFIQRFPRHKLASQSYLTIAETYSDAGRFLDAEKLLVDYLNRDAYARDPQFAEARLLLGFAYGRQEKFPLAIETFRRFLKLHPTHKLWQTAQSEIINAKYLQADLYRRKKQYVAAQQAWLVFLREYPLDSRNPAIMYEFGEMQRAQKRWQRAIRSWKKLISKYPNSPQADRAKFVIAQIMESQLGQPSEAVDLLRKVKGRNASSAKALLDQITSRQMTVTTERTFRTDEEPTVRVHLRNIEQVTVSVYQLDLESYFRKMKQIRGIASLDIDLIDPDDSFVFKVPKYQRFHPSDHRIPLLRDALKKGRAAAAPLAMIVTVASKTLKAKTLVLRSDLDIIIRSSRHDVLAYAQNMRTGQPWPQARILLADNQGIIASGVTGNDGVFRQSFSTRAAGMRVFAMAAGHVAESAGGVSGPRLIDAKPIRGFVQTDRPVYQPGEMVHVRGIAGASIGTKDKLRLRVFDPQNRVLLNRVEQVSPYGSVIARMQLPDQAMPGRYRALVTKDGDPKVTFSEEITVKTYRLQRVKLQVKLDSPVVFRGQVVTGTFRVTHYHGTPIANSRIRYSLNGKPLTEVRANSRGEVRFAIPVDAETTAGVLPLTVLLANHNVQRTVRVVLAEREFNLRLSTQRSVYLADETFELTVNNLGAGGRTVKPSAPIELTLFKQTQADGKQGSQLVRTIKIPVKVAAAQYRRTLRIKEGGRYTLRARTVDRRGTPVVASTALLISDVDDNHRLRILTNKTRWVTGDQAKVSIVWRERPATALITHQAERVIRYALVPLKRGRNRYTFPIDQTLAPNFELAVSVMTDQRNRIRRQPAKVGQRHAIDHATARFDIEKGLRIRLTHSRPAKPGGNIKLSIKTEDQRRRPGAAEVSIAVVDSALLDAVGLSGDIVSAFALPHRSLTVNSSSSVRFNYRPLTTLVNPRLLAESVRKQLTALEKKQLNAWRKQNQRGGFFGGGGGMGGGMGGGAMGGFGRGSRNATADAFARTDPARLGDGGDTTPLLRARGKTAQANSKQIANKNAQKGGNRSRSLSRKPTSTDVSWSVPLIDRRVSFKSLLNQGFPESPVATRHGRWSFLNLREMVKTRPDVLKQLRAELVRDRAVMFPFLVRQATVFWDPRVVTNDRGAATIRVPLPNRSAHWTVVAIGITKDQQTGAAQRQIVARKSIDAELVTPRVLSEGDQSGVRVLIHARRPARGVKLALTATIADKSVQVRRTVDVAAGETEVKVADLLRVPAQLPPSVNQMTVTLKLEGLGSERTVEERIQLRPAGVVVRGFVSGSAMADEVAQLELPNQMVGRNLQLQIRLGRPLDARFFLAVLRQQRNAGLPLERLANEVLAGIALHDWLARSAGASAAEVASIQQQVSRAVRDLVGRQLKNGSWHRWENMDLTLTAQVVWALTKAKAAGYSVPTSTTVAATSFLRAQVPLAEASDYRTRVALLHALVLLGRDEFTLANQLFRQRGAMDVESMVHLAVCFADMKRLESTRELLRLVRLQNPGQSSPRLLSFYLLALHRAQDNPTRQAQLATALTKGLKSSCWHPLRANGPATLALAAYAAKKQAQSPKVDIVVEVNGRAIGTYKLGTDRASHVIDVPVERLRQRKQQLRFRLQGRGAYAYACELSGVVPSGKLQSSTKAWTVERTYSPPQRIYFGNAIPRGFEICDGDFKFFRNDLTQLPVAKQGRVQIRIRPSQDAKPTASAPHLLSLWEPLPPGAEVVPASIKGTFISQQRRAGAIHFVVDGSKATDIQFDIHGMVAGKSVVPPTMLRQFDRPDRFVVSKPKPLQVLPAGKTSSDPYRLTPVERLTIGSLHFDRQEYRQVIEHLGPLMENWDLKSNAYRQVAELLMRSHLQIGPSKRAVHFFEMIVEKFPRLPIQFDDYQRVGAAYEKLGEFERSYLVFRATLQANFQRESYVAGSLDSEGRLLRSVEALSSILRDYPPEPYAAAAQYALCQRVYRHSSRTATNKSLQEQGLTRGDLIRRSLAMLRQYVTEHADDPATDEAALSIVTGLVEMHAYREAIQACRRFEKRYAKSHLLDDFWYVRGYCHYWLGERKDALDVCELVAKHGYKAQPTSVPVASENKDRAVYILGQVYHSLEQTKPALAHYRRVEGTIPQARDAIAMLTRKQLSVPEVSAITPNRPAEVELTYRNVKSVETTVYRIDLMKFSLLQGDLSGINRIQLAGIRPQHRVTTKLSDVVDYRRQKKKVKLPLKKVGAYLVVSRGEGIYASGLVLISPLKLEVAESRIAGRVQAVVRDAVKQRYLSRVQVKVIGSSNKEFVSGETDLRGVFIADNIQGTPTVIVQVNKNQYAFYRGKKYVSNNRFASNKVKKTSAGANILLDGVLDGHRRLQSKQESELEALYRGLRNVDGTINGMGGFGGGFGGGGVF